MSDTKLPLEAIRESWMKEMLTEDRLALKCAGCNMLAQSEGLDVKQVVLELMRRVMRHLPNCPMK